MLTHDGLASEQTYRIGIDKGGTFTDFVLLRESDGGVVTLKTLSTPSDFSVGVVNGLVRLEIDLRHVRYIVHGTTIGVNALIQRRGARTGLLTTHGFEDVLQIQWMNKPEMYNLFYRKPVPLVRRRDRIGIDERVDGQGRVLKGVDPEEVRAAVGQLVDRGIEAVAICTINSYANPENEQAIFEMVREECPEIHVSVSHLIARQRREYERSSTTVLNAYIAAPMEKYLTRLERELAARGFRGTFLVMRSNGGVMTLENARAIPVHTLLSGPVGGSVALSALGTRLGAARLIGFDMGGTSSDISVVLDGKPQMSQMALVEGYPLMTPVVNVDSIGAGGGSIATVKGFTSLRVGPASAGASPGPACYRQGGTEATVTDANLILGRLDSETPLADDLFLDREAASTAIAEHVGQKLGMGVEEAALAINRIADVKMAYAIRGLTLEKGLDPREFVLVAFGGAGPLHAASIASLLGIPRVLVPRAPGNFSAWGMLSTDLRHDLVRTIDLPGDPSCLPTLRQAFQEMEEQGQEIMARHGANQSPRQLRWGVDARYKGQEHSLTVPFEAEKIDTTALAKLLADFHSLHESQYGHSSPEDSAEFVATRLELNARLEKPPFYKLPTDAKMLELTAVSFRDVTFESGIRRTPVFERSALFPGCRIEGPAIINEPSSTVLVPPSAILQVDGDGNLIIDLPSTEG